MLPVIAVSKDNFRHGPRPDEWNERFFFTRPQRRRRPSPPRDKFFVGDASQCTTGSCEFFLFCMVSGGVVEGGCGGFLMSCCNRPNQVGHKTIVKQVGPKDQAHLGPLSFAETNLYEKKTAIPKISEQFNRLDLVQASIFYFHKKQFSGLFHLHALRKKEK